MSDLIAARVVATVPPAVSWTLNRARQLEAQGLKLIYLMRGEPDFGTPAPICEAAIQALKAGHTHYAPTQGISELRQAVTNRMLRDFEFATDPDQEVLITAGATMGIYVAVMAVIDPGDEVIMFDPVYDPYPTIVRMAGGIPVQLPSVAQPNGHFVANKEMVERALSARTKAILINNPWNPTGTVMTKSELCGLIDLAEANNLIVIVDEIYEKLTFDGRIHHHLASLSPGARDRTITVNSFSKTYAMTGWRIGYNIASPTLTRAMLRIAEQFSRSAATFIQFAGVAALDGPQDAVQHMVDTYARRRDLIADLFKQAGIETFRPPEGTFFALLDTRRFEKDSAAISDYLLQHANVVTIPGSAYGAAGEGYIRLSFAYHEDILRQGVYAIIKALERL